MNESASSRSGGRGRKKQQGTSPAEQLSAARLDALHDAGDDLTPHMDLAGSRRPGRETRRVNVDFPVDLLAEIDREARRLGVTRQALIKLRLADTLPSRRGEQR
jgi:D-serine deaminase-like pyridoxal phosphate-dependent protein